MTTRSFEHTVRFYETRTTAGESISFPIVTVALVQPDGTRITLPLLFDTGASVTTLRHDLFPLLGLSSWDVGAVQNVSTAGGENPVEAYRYEVRLEFFGKEVQCPIHLQKLPRSPLYQGLFGREQIFEEFGFGFWEGAKELYVTLQP